MYKQTILRIDMDPRCCQYVQAPKPPTTGHSGWLDSSVLASLTFESTFLFGVVGTYTLLGGNSRWLVLIFDNLVGGFGLF